MTSKRRSVGTRLAALGTVWVAVGMSAADPQVTNVRAAAIAGTTRVEVVYDLSDAPAGGATVSVAFSETGDAPYDITPLPGALSGDVGSGITDGSDRRIVWDAWATLPVHSHGTTYRAAVTATDPGVGEGTTITLPGDVTMELVHIPAGTFMMGSPEDERGRGSGEDLHQVTLTEGYWIGKYEVTQAQWQAVTGSNPASGYGVGDDYPVYFVSWDDIAGDGGFIDQLNDHLETTEFRLPTEAEWERAARAGTQTAFSFDTSGNPEWDLECGSFPEAEPYMVWCGNGSWQAEEVGSRLPNGYGLYDVHGNVSEWVADWYETHLGADPVTNPTGPASGSYRVFRGGDWNSDASHCRSARRNGLSAGVDSRSLGFRLARSEDGLSAGSSSTTDSNLFTIDLRATDEQEPFRVCGNQATGRDEDPAVAYNPDRDEYLVVWSDERNIGSRGADIWAQRVGGDGALVGSNVRVSGNAATGDESQPFVVYDGLNQRYLVVWSDTRLAASQGTDIWGQMLDADGNKLGINRRVTGAAAVGDDSRPSAAYNPGTGTYVVVWSDGRSPTARGTDIWAQRLTPTNEKTGMNYRISGGRADGDDGAPAIAYNSSRDEFLIAFECYRNDRWTIFGRRLDGNGERATLNFVLSGTAGTEHHSSSLAYSTARDEYVLVWSDDRNSGHRGWDVFAQVLTSTGDRDGQTYRVCDVPARGDDLSPSIAYSEAADRYVVVWQDGRSDSQRGWDIRARILDDDGTVVDDDFRVSGTAQTADELLFPGAGAVGASTADGQALMVCTDTQNADSRDRDVWARTIVITPTVPQEITITLPGGVEMELVHVPAGTFMMGSPSDERGRDDDEDLHQVTLTEGYYIGKYEVTQAQWEAVMGSNPARDYGVGDNYPVYYVSWNDIAGDGGFIDQLNDYLGTTKLRLPTEAEWERAARAGTQTPFSFGDDTSCAIDDWSFCDLFDRYMVWCGNENGRAEQVGSRLPNGYGLYDMHGNVLEWVADWYQEHLGTDPVTDPTGPASGSFRDVRGGARDDWAENCRSAARGATPPTYGSDEFGFRLAGSE